jgi:hypothetical protein
MMKMRTVCALLLAVPLSAAGPAAGPATYSSPKLAADAFIQAVAADDTAAMLQILGPDSKDLVASGDPVEDKNNRGKFAEWAKEKTNVAVDPSNPRKAILSIGSEDWPFPIPIIQKNGKWSFNAKDGAREILLRRIGRNELDAIDICQGYVEAQKEYAEEPRDESGLRQYAQRFISTPGKKDGLAWKNDDGSVGGPVGETIAQALSEGYTNKSQPFHGYYFRILTKQGPAAPLGELDYVVNGAMIGGFALVAWPANYRATGVDTFLVGYDGIVYQKNLGPDTAKLAPKIDRYNPDKSWTKVPDIWLREADQTE